MHPIPPRTLVHALSLAAGLALVAADARAGGLCHRRVVLVPVAPTRTVVREVEAPCERVVVREVIREVERPDDRRETYGSPQYPVSKGQVPTTQLSEVERVPTRKVRETIREYEEPVEREVRTVRVVPVERYVVREAAPVQAVVVRRKNCLTKW